jgi:hypothetical protein
MITLMFVIVIGSIEGLAAWPAALAFVIPAAVRAATPPALKKCLLFILG